MKNNQPDEDLDSRVELKFSVGIEFIRRRVRLSDKWEARMDAVALIVICGIVVLFLVFTVVPKIISLFGG